MIARAVNKNETSNTVALRQRTMRLHCTALLVVAQHGYDQFIQAHEGFDLIAGVDPSQNLRDKFEKKYSLPTFSSVDDLLTSDLFKESSDNAFSIATPTER